MKKASLIIALTGLLSLTPLGAGGIDFQAGGGYSGYFTGSGSADPDLAAGFSLFGGAGYRFFPTLSAGGEYEFGKSWSLEDELDGLTVSLNEHIPRIFVKVNALNLLTLTVLGGVDFQNWLVDGDSRNKRQHVTAGLRINALFAYAQYMMVFHDETDHRFSAGVIFHK